MKKMKEINIPKWCLGNCRGDDYQCCRCSTRLLIKYQEGDGRRLHSLCNRCYLNLKRRKQYEQFSGEDA